MIPTMLLAYDAAGNIVATLDYMVARNEHGEVIGLVDFAAHEEGGGRLREVWDVAGAVGSGTWPEFLGGQAHAFRADVAGGRIAALVHRDSGHRRERAAIEAAIRDRRAATEEGVPVDLRDIVGGPQRPLQLDEQGQNRPPQSSVRPTLPLLAASRAT